MMRSTKSLKIDRVFLKITDVLSYIGGLFSLTVVTIRLLFYTYNLWCY
jgi:hypothetical protein